MTRISITTFILLALSRSSSADGVLRYGIRFRESGEREDRPLDSTHDMRVFVTEGQPERRHLIRHGKCAKGKAKAKSVHQYSAKGKGGAKSGKASKSKGKAGAKGTLSDLVS
jgi:hypothetical protein